MKTQPLANDRTPSEPGRSDLARPRSAPLVRRVSVRPRTQPVIARYAVSLLFDVSESMRGRKLREAADAARGFLNALTENGNVEVAICPFHGHATIRDPLQPAPQLSRSFKQFTDAEIGPGGTHIASAFDLARDILNGDGADFSVAILLSDGENTHDNCCPFKAADALKQSGALVMCVGFDADYDALRRFASSPEFCFSAADGAELVSFFRKFGKTLSATAPVGADPGVTLRGI